MFNHPYIALQVSSQLAKNNMIGWYETVKNLGPENNCATTELGTDHKQTRYFIRSKNGGYNYVIPLNRSLNLDEVDTISTAWNEAFPEEDFEINWSQPIELDQKHESVKDDVLKTMVLEAVKRAHSSWVNQKVADGWRYGMKLDTYNKVSPMCVPWENLSEKYKLPEYHRMMGLLQVLNEMGLKLTK